uniref:DekiORF85 n=1 Tax=Dendrolimus kikuchii nucleopolyhedrovirus TaxID=1219875 RepID=V9LSY0_9ABAC|nr:DekiORF85 [Dendrolimus kikuchii nucleopolyhedrovirus]
MWELINWQILNSDEIEVVPEHRSLAWRELIINVAAGTPLDNTFRTMFQKADLENFDYNTPIVYNIRDKSLTVYNERLRAALNRPTARHNDRTININIAHILIAFICIVVLGVVTAFLARDAIDQNATQIK